jgi:hypothetical protein
VPNLSPGGLFDSALIGVVITGLVLIGRYVVEVITARRAAKREDRREPLEQGEAAIQLAERVQKLADDAVSRSTASLDRAERALSSKGDQLDRATTALEEANRRYDRLEAHTIELHEWIANGSQQPAPDWPSWLPRPRKAN